MKLLRDMIPTSCPMIFAGNWEAEREKGWRWVVNLVITSKASKTTIDEYQTIHGKENVTVGHSFSEDAMKPQAMPVFCGLYVRDVDDLVSQLHETLGDTDALAEWLAKPAEEKDPDE